jgi:hypothetical protein
MVSADFDWVSEDFWRKREQESSFLYNNYA